LTTELRVLGREGRSGAEEVDVAGLAAGEVVVIAVEAAGVLAVGAVDNADPAAPAALSQGLGGETDAILGDQACIGDQSREIGGDGVGTGGVGSVEVDRGRMAEKERKSR